MSGEKLVALTALKDTVSEEMLDESGRYFVDGNFCDLTQCHHGDTGNFRNREDGKAVALLWNLWKSGALDQAMRPLPCLDAALRAAYKRGAEWQAANSDPREPRLGTAEGLRKAAYDYADKTVGPAAPARDVPKYVNLVNGDICELASQGPDGVTFRREGSTKLAYLGRSEFDKRFEPIPPAPPQQMVGGLAMIAAERERQIAKGYDAAHDDTHVAGDIINSSWGASARIYAAQDRGMSGDVEGYTKYLIQAAAQIVAEIQRVQRAACRVAEGSADA